MKNLRLGLKRFIVSYALIIGAVVLSINGIFYRVVVPIYEQELINLNEQSLKSLGSLFDKLMTSRIRQLFLGIILDEEQGFMNHFEHDPRNNLWDVTRVHGALKLLVSDNSDLLQSLSIHYTDTDFINSSNGFKYLRDTDNQNVFRYSWTDIEASDRKDAIFSSTEIVNYSMPNTTEPVITWIKAFPYTGGSSHRKGSIVFNIKEDFIRDMLTRFSGGDGERGIFFIIDARGSMVYRNRKDVDLPENITELLRESQGHDTFNLRQDKTVISGIYSDDGELLYLFFTPEDAFFKRSEEIKNRIIFFSFLVLGVSLLVIYVVSSMNYRPIREIVRYGNQFLDSIAIPRDFAYSVGDDFQRIQLTLKVLGDFVMTNYSVVKENFFLELIEKRFNPELVAEKSAYLDIRMPYDKFRVAVVTMDEGLQSPGAFPPGVIACMNAQNKEGFFCFAIEKESGRAAWILNYQDVSVYTAALEAVTASIVSLRKGRNRSLRVATGDAYGRMEDLWRSYKEAIEVIPYFFVHDDIVLDHETKCPDKNGTPDFGLYSKKMPELLNQGEIRSIGVYVESILNRIRFERVPYEQIRIILNEIVELSEFTIVTSYPAFGKENFKELRVSMDRMTRLDDFSLLYNTLVTRYISYRDEVRNTIHDEVLGRIVDYLDQHVAEPTSLRDLSDYFHISYSHLSSLFNKYTGVPFPAYMMRKKIEAASRMLLESDAKVAEIAAAVGLADTGYFIKQFKKYFGMTPQTYRLHNSPSPTIALPDFGQEG